MLAPPTWPQPTFRATDFGAVADGSTSATAAIQQAIDAASASGGGRVILDPAEAPYLISETLTIRSGGIVLSGAGATIQLASRSLSPEGTPVLLVEGSEDNPIHNVRVEGLTLDANYYVQTATGRARGIEIRYAVGARIVDVTITRAYVGLDFGRGCVDGEVRRVTITDYAEDAFDAGGDADVVSGSTARDIRFIDVVARDAPRGDAGGNAFEIEDGAQGVLIQNALVENVSGNGVGLRNHRNPGMLSHSHDVEIRDVMIHDVGGKFAIFGRSEPRERAGLNSYRNIRLHGVRAQAPVAFYGPIADLQINGGEFGDIWLGFDTFVAEPISELALENATLEGVTAQRIRVNGIAGRVILSRIEAETIAIEGAAKYPGTE